MQKERKPLERVYAWIGFVVFWPSVLGGIYSVIHWFVWSHKFIEAAGL